MEMIRWGIIGCGDVTEIKSGPAFNKVHNSKLVAVMRRNELLLKDYADRHQVPLTFTNAQALIAHPEIDAIYIATPPHVHEQYAIEALQAGKMVYVEKPMSTSVAACLHMQEVANELNGKLVVAHYRRKLPLFLKVKELLAQNSIGKITDVQITMHKKAAPAAFYENNWRVEKSIAGAGLFYDLAPHQLDLVFYYFGSALSCNGYAYNKAGLYTVEDTVLGAMKLTGDINFTGDWCFAIDHNKEKDEFKIIGTEGIISFPVFGHTVSIYKNGTVQQLEFDPPQHIQQPFIENVVSYFLGRSNNPCTTQDALHSMMAMEKFVNGSPQ